MRQSSSFVALLVAFTAVLGVAVWFGVAAAPDPMVTDPRRSSHLTGPNGASGFAEVLERLGAEVDQFDRPLFRLDTTGIAGTDHWLAVLEPSLGLGESELRSIGEWLGAGGSVFAAGETGLEECLGLRVWNLPAIASDRSPHEIRRPDSLSLHAARAEFRPLRGNRLVSSECEHVPPVLNSDVVLSTTSDDSVAMVVALASGSYVFLLADSRYVANEDLKDTDAGRVLLPEFLRLEPATVTFDEFHHDFGQNGSLYGAAMSWMTRAPLGWAMIQLVLVSLLVIGARAVRFGPALEVVHRERRSPLDHVDALATGLARARRDSAAVTLLVDGLRRRLGRPGSAEHASAERLSAWLDTLKLATPTDAARGAVDRLKAALNQPADKGQVLAAARTVEELWEALQPKAASAKS